MSKEHINSQLIKFCNSHHDCSIIYELIRLICKLYNLAVCQSSKYLNCLIDTMFFIYLSRNEQVWQSSRETNNFYTPNRIAIL